MKTADDKAGLCWGCDYPLRGLDGRNCPECGRAYDSADARSFNRGRAVGAVVRRAARSPGWGRLAVAAAGTALIGLATRWPADAAQAHPWFADLRYYADVARSRARLKEAGSADAVYLIGLAVWAIVLLRCVLGMLVVDIAIARRRRPPSDERLARRLGRRGLLLALAAAATVMVGIGWPYRLGLVVVYAEAKAASAGVVPDAANMPKLDDRQRGLALRTVALHGPGDRERLTAIKILVDEFGGDVPGMLAEALRRPAGAGLRAWQLRLFAVYGHEGGGAADAAARAAVARRFLDDASPDVRAAAADAVGLLHGGMPLSQLNRDYVGEVETTSNPPVGWTSGTKSAARTGGVALMSAGPESPLDEATRRRLTELMTGGATAEEREAAARALVAHPPAGYRLRVAEWGVWQLRQAGTSPGKGAALVSSQLADVLPAAHAVGGAVATFANRVPPLPAATPVWKPVIHLTVDRPLAVDLHVVMTGGRPLYVYPMPDDFELAYKPAYREPHDGRPLTPSERRRRALLPPSAPGPPILAELDPPADKFPALDASFREGYPWLAPAHRTQDGARGGGLTGIGFRWQSLIVSPTKLPWMNEPRAGDDPRHAWWARLREVSCAWVCSRGESERFVYYDGPTLVGTLVDFAVAGEDLVVREAARVPGDANGYNARPTWAWDPLLTRRALLVRVGADAKGAVAREFEVPVDARAGEVKVGGRAAHGGDAEEGLRAILRSGGLADGEADGMVAAWRQAFFRTPGTRLLIALTGVDYEALCPMTVHPPPTDLARVGLIWVELP